MFWVESYFNTLWSVVIPFDVYFPSHMVVHVWLKVVPAVFRKAAERPNEDITYERRLLSKAFSVFGLLRWRAGELFYPLQQHSPSPVVVLLSTAHNRPDLVV